MKKTLIFHYGLSIILLAFAWVHRSSQLTPPPSSDYVPPVLDQHFSQLEKQHCFAKIPEGAGILRAYFLGQKLALTAAQKKIHRTLQLQHLYTPSGLHLSALMVMFAPVKILPVIGAALFFCLEMGLYGVLFYFPFALALKRIALWRLMSHLHRFLKGQFLAYDVFLLAFFFDYLLGTFVQSPLSFAYSFLFLGMFVHAGVLSKIQIFFHLIFCQLILAFFQETPFLLLMPLFNLGLSFVFSLFFPLILFGVVTKICFLITYPLIIYLFLLKVSSQIVAQFSWLQIEMTLPLFGILLTFGTFYFQGWHRFKKINILTIIVILSAIHSRALNPPQKKFLRPYLTQKQLVPLLRPHEIKKRVYSSKGLKVFSKKGDKFCKENLIEDWPFIVCTLKK